MENKINIENYEAFLLDYMEGNLSTEDFVALQIFAAQHPELNIDLNELELVELNSDSISFEGKNNIKKVSDEQFVAYIENQLSAQEKKSVESICSVNKTLATDLKLYKATITKADETIVFENKSQLKKQETKVIWLYSREVLAAAASLILIAGLWFMFKNFDSIGSDTFNSEKIMGNSSVKTIAITSKASAPSFTVEKSIAPAANTNPVVVTNTKINPETKEQETAENKTLLATNTKTNTLVTPKEIVPEIVNNEIASNNIKPGASKTNNQSYIITEKTYDEDEKVLTAATPKKGFWNKAINALNGLNKLGVKKAKGTETVETNNEQYVLTLGNFKVENHKYNAE